MDILAWIVVGIVGGFIGSLVVGTRGQDVLGDLVLGIIGAVVGGWLFQQFGASGATGINFHSMMVSAAAAIVVLVVYRTWRGNRVSA